VTGPKAGDKAPGPAADSNEAAKAPAQEGIRELVKADRSPVGLVRVKATGRVLTAVSAGGRGVGGAIESIEGNTLTVTTPRGPVTVTTGGDTTVRKIVDGSLEDLEQGAQIRVTGQRDEEGIVKATSITLIPEGAQEFIGRRGPRQER